MVTMRMLSATVHGGLHQLKNEILRLRLETSRAQNDTRGRGYASHAVVKF